jgi:hypothetical protein
LPNEAKDYASEKVFKEIEWLSKKEDPSRINKRSTITKNDDIVMPRSLKSVNGDANPNAKRCKREELELNDDDQTLDGSQASTNGSKEIILPASLSTTKYSDIVSYRFQVLWEAHQEPNWGRFVYSCRVIAEERASLLGRD